MTDNSLVEEIDILNKESWNLSRIDDKKSLDIALKAEVESLKANYLPGLADSYLNQGWYYLNITHFVSSNSLFQQAKDLYYELGNDKGILKANAGLSGVAFHLGDYELCLDLNSETIEMSTSLGYSDRQITALTSSAQVYMELDKHSQALDYAYEAYDIGKKIENFEQKGILLKTIADCYIAKKEYEKAINYSKQAYEYYQNIGQYQGIFESINTLGTLYYKKGDRDKAEEYLLKSCSLAKGYTWEEVIIYSVADFYYATKDYSKSLLYIEQCIELAKKVNSKNYLKKSFLLKSRIEENRGNLKEAYNDIKQYITYKNEVENDNRNSSIQKIDMRLEISKIKRKNSDLLEANEVLKRIGKIGQRITATLEAEDILNIIYDSIKDLMDASTFGLAYYYEEKQELDYKIFVEDSNKLDIGVYNINDQNSIACWSIRNNKDIIISDIEKEYKKYINKLGPIGYLTKSLIYLPLHYDDKIIGLISIQSRKINAYSKRQIEVLKLLRGYVVIAVQNSIEHEKALQLNEDLNKANRELEKASLTDNLTSLYNRRYFHKVIESDINIVLRHSHTDEKRDPKNNIGFLIVDIDHFKEVNDTYGHPVGDEIIKQVSFRLKDALRKSDLIVRWGGEEFLIMAKETDLDGIKVIVSKLLKAISETEFVCNGVALKKTISIGFSMFPFYITSPCSLSWNESINITDRALYIAKESGRNRGAGIYPKGKTKIIDTKDILDNLDLYLSNGDLKIHNVV